MSDYTIIDEMDVYDREPDFSAVHADMLRHRAESILKNAASTQAKAARLADIASRTGTAPEKVLSLEWYEWIAKIALIANGQGDAIPKEPARWVNLVREPTPDPGADLLQQLHALKDLIAEQAAEIERLRAGDTHNFPENLTDKLSDWDAVPDVAPVEAIPEDLAQFMSPDETLPDAVERLTPGLDELLGMAEGLSETSLEMAIAAIPLKRANDWTSRIYDERAVLRTKRGTDGENLGRENLLRRVESVFSRAGSKI